MKDRICQRLLSYLLPALFLLAPQMVNGQFYHSVVMHSGQEAPGTNGALFDSIYSPEPLGIDVDQNVLFRGWLQSGTGDVTDSTNEGYWLYEEEGKYLITRKGGAINGLPGRYFLNDRMPTPYFGYQNGVVGLDAYHSTSGTNDITTTQSFLVAVDDTLFEVLNQDTEIFLTGLTIIGFQVLAFNGTELLFNATVDGDDVTNIDDGVLCIMDINTQNIDIIMRLGGQMPEAPFGFNYYTGLSTYNGGNPLNDYGDTYFQIRGRDFDTGEDIGAVYAWSPERGVELVDISGIDSTIVVFAHGYRMNRFGDVAGRSFIDWPTKEHLWVSNLVGERKSYVKEGDAAPGVDNDEFKEFAEYVLFEKKTVGFLASTRKGKLGIWIADSNAVHKVAAVGDQAPGMPDGMQFFRVNHMKANPFGQIAFSDLVYDPNTMEESIGLWIGNDRGLHLAVAQGDTIELSNHELKVIHQIFAGNEYKTRTGQDGHATTFNEFGELIFKVDFLEGGNALIFAGSKIVVNSEGDDVDEDVDDGVCDTGGPFIEGRPECTLRAALQESNERQGKDRITFDIPTAGDNVYASIILSSALPVITDWIDLDATTQKQGMVEVNGNGHFGGLYLKDIEHNEIQGLVLNNFGLPPIVLESSSDNYIHHNYIGTGVLGLTAKPNDLAGMFLTFESKNNTISKNLISGNDGHGIYMLNETAMQNYSSWNTISNNLIGTDELGLIAIPNTGNGIEVDGCVWNSIYSNLISGNHGAGIRIRDTDSTGNYIGKNWIGVDSTAKRVIPNQGHGVYISQSSGVLIYENLISGNNGDGIYIQGKEQAWNSNNILAQRNEIEKNRIGTSDTIGPYHSLGNQNGITIDSSTRNVIHENEVRGNRFAGINMLHSDRNSIYNNYLGARFYTTSSGGQTHGLYMFNSHENRLITNRMYNNNFGIFMLDASSNEIFGHRIIGGRYGIVVEDGEFNKIVATEISNSWKLGIDLSFDGVTLNDNMDLDEGSNGWQNFPELTSATIVDSAILVRGVISGTPNYMEGVMEFFYSKGGGLINWGPGANYLGTFPVSFDGQGVYEFEDTIPFSSFDHPSVVRLGAYITAIGRHSNGNTSEFSNRVKILIPEVDRPEADLWVTITDSLVVKTPTYAEIEYTLRYGNIGPEEAQGVLLSNVLPENGSYTDSLTLSDTNTAVIGNLRHYFLPDLSPGESGELTVRARIDTSDGKVITYSTIESASTDNIVTNNADTAVTDLDSFWITSSEHYTLVNGFDLSQNVPNPFRDKTSIGYFISEDMYLSVMVFDTFGKKVATLLDNVHTQPGEYYLEFVPEGLSSGIYYYAIVSDNYYGVRKMILLN